ncbi:uncharacterized protein BDZ99DRAFT_517456 [Mytilinidion resinicola]|uniref:Uncharacterized protein n=1 Tax=Mytilinidion resinicola TaxID=574789 RepID=A0A6A6YWJ6_9PEZI|nr:uncharacterized protein BDZ99DRAFT_517456 [Mytilinidion resinicola]KAF2813171.1 hypothetical protein BDZ99DRAFT_517456 [Mytilinidion resinicola]
MLKTTEPAAHRPVWAASARRPRLPQLFNPSGRHAPDPLRCSPRQDSKPAPRACQALGPEDHHTCPASPPVPSPRCCRAGGEVCNSRLQRQRARRVSLGRGKSAYQGGRPLGTPQQHARRRAVHTLAAAPRGTVPEVVEMSQNGHGLRQVAEALLVPEYARRICVAAIARQQGGSTSDRRAARGMPTPSAPATWALRSECILASAGGTARLKPQECFHARR